MNFKTAQLAKLGLIMVGLAIATTGIVKAAPTKKKQTPPKVYVKKCQPLFNHAFSLSKKGNRKAYTKAKRRANACLVENRSGVKKKKIMQIHAGNDQDIRTNDELFHADRYNH